MKSSVLRQYFLCPACKKSRLNVVPFEERGDDVIHGVLTCAPCGAWYRHEDRLPELLKPSLQDAKKRESFQRRFQAKWDGWTAALPPASAAGDEHKWEQKNFYDEDAIPYETQMLRQPFWSAFDRTYRDVISVAAPKRELMLEIGGGTGRVSLPMSAKFGTILSFDLSESMVRTALGKRDQLAPAAQNVHYFIADAENIPLLPEIFDATVFSGILHHVESPDIVIREMTRTLKPGGHFVGLENNRSVFRPIFELMMRVRKLWNEKAHEEHYIMSHAEIRKWLRDAGVGASIWTSVFMPPHLFNLFSTNGAERLLRFTDGIFRLFPWLRFQGGLVLFQGEKPANAR